MAYGGSHNGSNSAAPANWSGSQATNTANYELIVPGGASQQDITQDLGQGGTAGRTFKVAAPFVKNIGTRTGPLILQLSDGSAAQRTSANTEGALVYQAGGGEMWVQASTGIDNTFASSNGLLGLVTGTFGRVHVARGGLVMKAAVQNDYCEFWGGTSIIEANDSGGNNPTQFDVLEGAKVTLYRPISNGGGILNIHSGTVILDVSSATATVAVNLFGGELIHYGGNITTLYHWGGKHNYSRMNKASTITTCYRRPNAKFEGVRRGDALTITTDTEIGFPEFK